MHTAFEYFENNVYSYPDDATLGGNASRYTIKVPPQYVLRGKTCRYTIKVPPQYVLGVVSL